MSSRFKFTCTVLSLYAVMASVQLRAATQIPPTGGDFTKLLARVGQSEDFNLDTSLEITPEGLARTRDGVVKLFGDLYSNKIQSIRVNGKSATIDLATKAWSYSIDAESGMLNKGVNRIFVQAFANTESSGRLLGQRVIDIYFESATWTEKSGVIVADEFAGIWKIVQGIFTDSPWHVIRWTAAESPYHISTDVIVPEHYQLVIEPGVTIFFEENTKLTVRGELHAAGTDSHRIHMRSTPGLPFVSDIRPELKPGPPRWGGVQFRGSESAGNLVSKTDIEYAQTPNGSIGVHQSRLRIDDVSFSGTHQFMIFTDESSLIVENCIFGDMFSDDVHPLDMTPPIDNEAEHIKGRAGVSFPEDGHYIIRNNYFGTNRGHNDVIDVDSNQYPDSILQILNNYFVGAGDEAIDGGGDILVEGNIFRNIKKDRDNDGDGEANAISTGDTLNTVLVITRNVFIDIDHVVNFKRGAFGYFENNTVIGITPPHWSLETDPPRRMLDFSVFNFLIPDYNDPLHSPPRDSAGLGTYTSGNIFVDVPQTIFGHPDLNPTPDDLKSRFKFWLKSIKNISLIEMHDSLLQSTELVENADRVHGRKFRYDVGAAQFVNTGELNFTLQKESPGYRSGPNGLDMGAMAPLGASISGEPAGTSTSNRATLVIGGPGIFSFVYRVNDGPWSDEIRIGDPRDYTNSPLRRTATLKLDDLQEGRYTVYVRGRNFAGELQSENMPTVSKSWVVRTNSAD